MTTDLAAWAIETLERLEMPPEEVHAVIGSGDPAAVRRHLELHREWLEERLGRQRRTLALLERYLTEMIAERHASRRAAG